MHPYYQQNEERLKRQMNAYLILVRLEIEQIFGKAYDEAFEEIWGYYRAQMLERCPYIGGDRSSGTKNLTGCLFFIAVGVCGKNHGLSTHEWGRLATTIYQRWFARLPRSLRRAARFLFRQAPGVVNMALRRRDRRNARIAQKHPGGFITETLPPTAEYSLIYLSKRCPINDFCRRYGYMEYLPYMCNLDYVMFAAFEVPLYREKTCASGDGVCDFKLKRRAPVPDIWPPHILDDADSLK